MILGKKDDSKKVYIWSSDFEKTNEKNTAIYL